MRLRHDPKLQRRVTDAKDEIELFDILDVGNQYLEQHARIRRNAYVSQGYETIEESGP